MKIKQLLSYLVCILIGFSVQAQNIPSRPNPPRLVNDFANILTSQQRAYLEHKLSSFSDSTSNQIAIVTVADLDNTSISDYSAKLFDKWGIGSKEHNNGVLILVKPPQRGSRGEVFISTGYGLEGAIPDALAGRIVDYELIPAFKNNNYFLGLNNATETIMKLASGEYSIKSYMKNKGKNTGHLFIILFVVFAFILKLTSIKRGRKQVISSSRDVLIPPIFFWGFPFSGGYTSNRGGSYDNYSGGFGGFDSFTGGGGGFGGFGGGFTGGGGAGGSW